MDMINKIFKLFVVAAGVSIVGLLTSAFSMQSFLHSQTRFQSIVASGETGESVINACRQLHVPFLARSLNVFTPLTIVIILIGIVLFFFGRQQGSSSRQQWGVASLTGLTILTFLGVQLWEPDYLLILCK
jgi:hypothetical protein